MIQPFYPNNQPIIFPNPEPSVQRNHRIFSNSAQANECNQVDCILVNQTDSSSIRIEYDSLTYYPYIIERTDFNLGSLSWQFTGTGAIFVSSSSGLEAQLSDTLPLTEVLYHLLPVYSYSHIVVYFEVQGLSLSSSCKIYVCDSLGNIGAVLFETSDNGTHYFVVSNQILDAIAWRIIDNTIPTGIIQTVSLNFLGVSPADNPFKVCVKNGYLDTVSNIDSNVVVSVNPDGITFAWVTVDWASLLLPKGKYYVYCDWACLGKMELLDGAMEEIAPLSPWQKTELGGTVSYGVMVGVNRGIGLTPNGSGLPLGIYQSDVLSVGMVYKVSFSILQNGCPPFPEPLQVIFQTGTQLSDVYFAEGSYHQEIVCMGNGDFGFYVIPTPIHSGCSIVLDNVVIEPLLRISNLSYPICLEEKHPCTLLLRYRDSRGYIRFQMPYLDGWEHSLRIKGSLKETHYTHNPLLLEPSNAPILLLDNQSTQVKEFSLAPTFGRKQSVLVAALRHEELWIDDGKEVLKIIWMDKPFHPERTPSTLSTLTIDSL